ncbi:hypothetical protein B0H13DRAFT_2339804 [Mycena leptocephala]|nr:hypothetical protein B0H13DRAFT_2339804 [Mycena leptocephala]
MSSVGQATRALDEHNRLSLSHTYAPNNLIQTAFEWVKHKSGKILRKRRHTAVVDHTTPLEQVAFVSMVGTVSEHNAQLTTVANYKAQFGSSAAKAKYSIQLDCPSNNPALAAAWHAGLANLHHLEQMVCDGSANFFVDDKESGLVSIHLSKPLFEPKGKPFNPGQWQIPADCREAFTLALQGHDLRAMRAFDVNDQPIVPQMMQQALPGSLVAATWKMIFYNIRKEDNSMVASLTGEITQLIVLEPPRPKPVNVFSSARPYRPAPTSTAPFAPAGYHAPTPVSAAPLPQVPYQPLASAPPAILSQTLAHSVNLATQPPSNTNLTPKAPLISLSRHRLLPPFLKSPLTRQRHQGLIPIPYIVRFNLQAITSIAASPAPIRKTRDCHRWTQPICQLRPWLKIIPRRQRPVNDARISPTWDTPPSPAGLFGSANTRAQQPPLTPTSGSPYKTALGGGQTSHDAYFDTAVSPSWPVSPFFVRPIPALTAIQRSSFSSCNPGVQSPLGTAPWIPLATRPLSRATSTLYAPKSAESSMPAPSGLGVPSHAEQPNAPSAPVTGPAAAPVDPSPFYDAGSHADMNYASENGAVHPPSTPPNKAATNMPNTPGREQAPLYSMPFHSAPPAGHHVILTAPNAIDYQPQRPGNQSQTGTPEMAFVNPSQRVPLPSGRPSGDHGPVTQMLTPTLVQRVAPSLPAHVPVNTHLLLAFDMGPGSGLSDAGPGSWEERLLNLNDTWAPTPARTHNSLFAMDQPRDNGFASEPAAFSPPSGTLPMWFGAYGDVAQSFLVGADNGAEIDGGTSCEDLDSGLVPGLDITLIESTESDSSASSSTGDSGLWETTGSSDDTDEPPIDRYKRLLEIKRGKRKADAFDDEPEVAPRRRLFRVNWDDCEEREGAEDGADGDERNFAH